MILSKAGSQNLIRLRTQHSALSTQHGEALGTCLVWQVRGAHVCRSGVRPLVMGIVNVTPDSFSDGGQFTAHGGRHRPWPGTGPAGSRPPRRRRRIDPARRRAVPLEEELRRVLPVVEGLAAPEDVPLSVDTSKAEVARLAWRPGRTSSMT